MHKHTVLDCFGSDKIVANEIIAPATKIMYTYIIHQVVYPPDLYKWIFAYIFVEVHNLYKKVYSEDLVKP